MYDEREEKIGNDVKVFMLERKEEKEEEEKKRW